MANKKHPGLPDWWDEEVATQYEKEGYNKSSSLKNWDHASASRASIEEATEYRKQFLPGGKYERPQFSKGVEESIAEASKYLTFADIETGGLKPDSPIYEMGFMHLEDGNPRFTHHFVKPTEIHTDKPGRIDQWSVDNMKKRDPNLMEVLNSSNITQKQTPGIAYREMRGRDVAIQNMRHERGHWNARDSGLFDASARGMELESFSPGQGLYPTDVTTKNLIEEASRVGRTGNLNSYLQASEDVFTKGIAPMFANRKEGVTRAVDVMDITKSVFAMAQNRGLMGNAGELFTGTSVSAYAKAMHGIDEMHIANMDNVLAGEMFHNFMGAGYAMSRGEELPEKMKHFFKNMTDMIPEQKQRNTVKNIIDTFKNQQEFLASEADGKPKWSLLEGSRIDSNMVERTLPLNVLNDTGEYERTENTFFRRTKLSPEMDEHAFTTDIDKLVNHWDEEAKGRHGVKADYKAALEEAKKQYINPYREALAKNRAGGLSGGEAITSALTSVAPDHAKAIKALESSAWTAAPAVKAAPPPAPTMGGKFKSFIKDNWKIGLAGAGLLFAANLISSSDDDYNYIEGMRHGGVAGGSRKSNTDFGSGWNALRGLARAGETFAEMIKSSEFQSALSSSIPRKILGQGVDATAEMRLAMFRGKPFPFVRKTGRVSETEAAMMDRFSGSVAPSVYGQGDGHIDMEFFSGETLAAFSKKNPEKVDFQKIRDAVGNIHSEGVYHNDLHMNNIMVTDDGNIGVIDYGRAIDTRKSISGQFTYLKPSGNQLVGASGSSGDAMKADIDRVGQALSSSGINTGTSRFPRTLDPPKQRRPRDPAQYGRTYDPSELARTADPSAYAQTLPAYSAVQGRPASNVNHNVIAGLPESSTAKARRSINTEGQFGSPWQGLNAGFIAVIFAANTIAGAAPTLPNAPKTLPSAVSTISGFNTTTVKKTVTPPKVGQNLFYGQGAMGLGVVDSQELIELGVESKGVRSWPDAIKAAKASGRKDIVFTAHGLEGTGFAIETWKGVGDEVDVASASWISEQLPERDGYRIFMESCNANSALATNKGYTTRTMKKMVNNAKRLGHTISAIRDSHEVVANNVFTRSKLGLSKHVSEANRPSASGVFKSSVLSPFIFDILGDNRNQVLTNQPGKFGVVDDGPAFGEWAFRDIEAEGNKISGSYLREVENNYIGLLAKQQSFVTTETVQTPFTTVTSDAPLPVKQPSFDQGFDLDILSPRSSRMAQSRRVRRRVKVRNRGKVAQVQSNAISHVAPEVLAHTEAPAVRVSETTTPIISVPKAEGVVSKGSHVIAQTPSGNIQGIAKQDWVETFTQKKMEENTSKALVPDQTPKMSPVREALEAVKELNLATMGLTPQEAQQIDPVHMANQVKGYLSATEQIRKENPKVAQAVDNFVREATSTGHPNRQTSNIVSAVAEQVAEHTAKPATEVAKVTTPINTVAKAKGAVSNRWGLIAGGMAAVGGLFWAMSGSSKKDGNNQFGSPWQGLRVFASDLISDGGEQYILMKARESRRREKEREKGGDNYIEGANPNFEGNSFATIDVNEFAVEDADTVNMFMSNGESTSLRLAGIDAPEIMHDNDDGSRVWPDQPYGQAAKSRLEEILAQQNNIRAVIDPTATETYGRPVAMLIGDQGQNINLQLVREGMASSLPFGKRSSQITHATEFNRAEEDAAAAQQGMWSTEAWQAAREAQMNSKRKITHTSYTDLGRLFSNFKTSSVLMRMRNPDAEFSEMEASGDRSDFNTIEGLKHGWVGANRKANLVDFGSGYQISDSIPRVPASYASKKRVIEGQYLANTQLRRSMKRENVVKHHRG